MKEALNNVRGISIDLKETLLIASFTQEEFLDSPMHESEK